MNGHELISEARAARRVALDEPAGKQLLAAFGLAIPKSIVISEPAEAAAACAALKSPLVLKVISRDIGHKSDVGGVKVGLNGVAEVEEAVRSMKVLLSADPVRIDGFLIEEMMPAGQEMVVGGVRDPQFGQLIMVGLGGIFVEILADVSFRICPVTRRDAEEMLDELKGIKLLSGARGRTPVSRTAIVDALLKVGGEGGLLMTHGEDIAEADINPLIVWGDNAVAVDARFLLTQSEQR
jgi:acyl-CoA synthetase (NDP forming)